VITHEVPSSHIVGLLHRVGGRYALRWRDASAVRRTNGLGAVRIRRQCWPLYRATKYRCRRHGTRPCGFSACPMIRTFVHRVYVLGSEQDSQTLVRLRLDDHLMVDEQTRSDRKTTNDVYRLAFTCETARGVGRVSCIQQKSQETMLHCGDSPESHQWARRTALEPSQAPRRLEHGRVAGTTRQAQWCSRRGDGITGRYNCMP